MSYTHRGTRDRPLARPEGLEPPTRGLEGRCSIQLSYRRVARFIPDGRGEKIRTSDLLLPRQVRYQAAPRPDQEGRLSYHIQSLLLNTRSGPRTVCPRPKAPGRPNRRALPGNFGQEARTQKRLEGSKTPFPLTPLEEREQDGRTSGLRPLNSGF